MAALADMTAKQRLVFMAKRRGRDTKAEMIVREFLDEADVAYELYPEDVVGVPEFVHRASCTAVFVFGCFWHTNGCYRKQYKTNREYWAEKFAEATARDTAAVAALRADGWNVFTVWECASMRTALWKRQLLRTMAPGRRCCNDCTHIAIPDYAHCRWCRPRYTVPPSVPPARPKNFIESDRALERRRKQLELCTQCGMPSMDGYRVCPKHLDIDRVRRKKVRASGAPTYYQKLLEQGLCRCRAPVKPGSTRCPACLKKLTREAKKRNQARKAEGTCLNCQQPAAFGLVRCVLHHEKACASAAKAIPRFIKRRRDANQCVTCKAPSTTYNCAKCRKRIRKRYRQKQKEQT